VHDPVTWRWGRDGGDGAAEGAADAGRPRRVGEDAAAAVAHDLALHSCDRSCEGKGRRDGVRAKALEIDGKSIYAVPEIKSDHALTRGRRTEYWGKTRDQPYRTLPYK
jgi:hypothetical protein